MKKIALGSDHGGFYLKELLKQRLEKEGYAVQDFGCATPEPAEYPEVAFALAGAVAAEPEGYLCGILCCGTGIGMSIAANKVKGGPLCRLLFRPDGQGTQRRQRDNPGGAGHWGGAGLGDGKDLPGGKVPAWNPRAQGPRPYRGVRAYSESPDVSDGRKKARLDGAPGDLE